MSARRFQAERGQEAFTGNELLLKGALEGGAALITGYPGSPVSDVFEAIRSASDLLNAHGIVGQIANNEALAAARLNGARLASLRAMAVMKSVGMHVAADGLAIGNLAEPRRPEGGCLVVVGDDPWNETTQINSDSRFLAQHLHMPILEPSTFQEMKDWIREGFELSGASDLYVAYVITTNLADGGGGVEVRRNEYPAVNRLRPAELDSARISIADSVMIPPHTSFREATLRGRHETFLALARRKQLNRALYFDPQAGSSSYPLGFIVSGISYCYLEHALWEMGLAGAFPILKLGSTYPLDREPVLKFLSKLRAAVVIEEKRPFLEAQVRSLLQESAQSGPAGSVPIYGKRFPDGLEGIPELRGLNPSILIERLGALILSLDLPPAAGRAERVRSELERVRATAARQVFVPARTPTFCPGCPHRDSAVVSLKLKSQLRDPSWARDNLGREPTDLIFHGESGCHSMLQFAPNEGLMQNYSGMGLGGGTGAGIDPFIRNKQVVFLGDSTFFHSGILAISDSLKNGQDITYVILDNKTTAMTGHQPTPANDFDIVKRKTFVQDIAKAVRGLAGGRAVPVETIDPSDRAAYAELLRRVVLKQGVKIVIADKECGITAQRRLKKEKKAVLRSQGFVEKEEFINITPEVCEYCLECARTTGCPGLTVAETDFGPKIAIDPSSCVSDSACAKAKACPAFEKVTVRRKQAPAARAAEIDPGELAPPPAADFESNYYINSFAVGGMGAGLVSAILVRAGMKQGYSVYFLDKKGLAIRNGGVYGHIIFSKLPGQVLAPVVPYGKADLILGIDILEAARGLDPRVNLRVASPDRSRAVINRHKTETVLSLAGVDHFRPQDLEASIRACARGDGFLSLDFSQISQEVLGSKLYANLLMLGAAFQKGWIPTAREHLEAAVAETVPKGELEENLRAFRLGRKLALGPEGSAPGARAPALSYREWIAKKSAMLTRRFGRKGLTRRYQTMVEEAVRWMHLDEDCNRQIALRVYELVRYEGLDLAGKYLALLWDVYRKDREDLGYAATRAAIVNLFKVLAVKDEVYVAELLTSPEKEERDRRRYNVDRARGDSISYRHLNRPRFPLGFWALEFDLETRDWMLAAMKRCRFLRRVLPGWHAEEREFRDFYVRCLQRFNFFEQDAVYRRFLEVLQAPESVNGYRELRAPKMREARARMQAALESIERADKGPASPVPGRERR